MTTSTFCAGGDVTVSKCETENGETQYSDHGVGDDILVMSQSVRGATEVMSRATTLFGSNNPQSIVDAFVLVGYTRNARGGKGEKHMTLEMLISAYKIYPNTVIEFLKELPNFGYWKDLLNLLVLAKTNLLPDQFKTLQYAVLTIMSVQYKTDLVELSNAYASGSIPHLSFVGKYLPRESSKYDKSINFISEFLKVCKPDMIKPPTKPYSKVDASNQWATLKRIYRTEVASLTAALNVPEVKMCSLKWAEINFSNVPSRAAHIYRKAFLNEKLKNIPDYNEQETGNRHPYKVDRVECRENVLKHVLEKGMNGARLFPHELVSKIMNSSTGNGHGNCNISTGERSILNAQWTSMREDTVTQIETQAVTDGVSGDLRNAIALSDVSGSMGGTPMEVSIALGILISEITNHAFRNRVITFETDPKWVIFDESDDIVTKVMKLMRAPWGGSTNFFGAEMLKIKIARDNKLTRAEIPITVCISDMQFDCATGFIDYTGKSTNNYSSTMFGKIKQEYVKLGLELGWAVEDHLPPTIVFWNVRDSVGHPVKKDDSGAVMLSGYSPALLKNILSGNALDEVDVEVVNEDGTTSKVKVQTTPAQLLKKSLDDSCYNVIRRICSDSTEKCLKDYHYDSDTDSMPSLEQENSVVDVDVDESDIVDGLTDLGIDNISTPPSDFSGGFLQRTASSILGW
jgi:hypothetical protein